MRDCIRRFFPPADLLPQQRVLQLFRVGRLQHRGARLAQLFVLFFAGLLAGFRLLAARRILVPTAAFVLLAFLAFLVHWRVLVPAAAFALLALLVRCSRSVLVPAAAFALLAFLVRRCRGRRSWCRSWWWGGSRGRGRGGCVPEIGVRKKKSATLYGLFIYNGTNIMARTCWRRGRVGRGEGHGERVGVRPRAPDPVDAVRVLQTRIP